MYGIMRGACTYTAMSVNALSATGACADKLYVNAMN